jgi:protein O-GlcNAc transferase
MTIDPQSAPRAFDEARNLVRAGRLQQAESLCQEVLRAQPVHGDALLLLGVIELQTGRGSRAATSFRAALQSNPSNAIAHALLGDALLELRQPQAALAAYECGLMLDASLVPAHFGRANALLDLERPSDALASYDAVLKLQPNSPEVLFNRGNAHLALRQHAAALNSYDHAIRLNPAYAGAYNNRGWILRVLQRHEEAREAFERALELHTDYVEALRGLGDTLLDLRRPEEALAVHSRAATLEPSSSEVHNVRGNSLFALRRLAEALAAYDEGLRLDPSNASAHYNRGNVLLQCGREVDALASIERALELKPDFTEALRARGDALLALGRPQSAAQAFAQLLRLQPEADYVPGALLHARQWCADWSTEVAAAGRDGVHQAVLEGRRADSPFSFLSVADDPAAQLRCAQIFVAERYPATTPLWVGQRYRHERIRLAYVSADFRVHAVSCLLAGVFERHDRRRFETIAVSLRPEEPSGLGRRVKAAFDRFIDVSGQSDREVAELLRALEIDIAVDLVGFTDGLRPQIFAHRAVPIQVNYLGFPGTMGAPYIDYLIADPFVIPPESTQHYSEQVVYLPGCFQANDDRRADSDRTTTRSDAGLPDSAFVFCCFNNGYKLNPTMFDIWMRLLGSVADSVLWLASSGEAMVGNLRREALRRGVDPRRLVFAERLPYEEYLNRLKLADLFLDTLPFNAGATASDALWSGLPVLTCAGKTFAARMAGSLVRAVGLPELVTPSLEHYEAAALELAQHPTQLSALRRRLGDTCRAAPVFDTDRCRRDLEAAYETMWRRHEGGGPV